MTEEEIEAVAEELAKIGGVSWYPGRAPGPLLRVVSERYRDRARVAIATLDRLRAGTSAIGSQQATEVSAQGPASGDQLQIGAIVVYRPPGDQRAIPCRVEKLDEGRAYLVPCPRPDVGWVSVENLVPVTADEQHRS
ncbi:hypothetical protein [Microvirga subterranea]|uniref:Uncharacterized protein n=1 Tax=Microvirga subterranea TaxID=186651 RepID=A0A370H949_9HYPH|nr:hypothetical protein [Microvirga subterranea]RDI52554.1 hypothetical protein DES45_11415 [Microvirga subterranea]